MRKVSWRAALVALIIAAPVAAKAQPANINLAPRTVIGNPNAINAPAQAISFGTLSAEISVGNVLLQHQTLPLNVDLNNLPPQTVIGNPVSAAGLLSLITFSQLQTFSSQAGLPTAISNSYDPTNVPGLSMVGNLSYTLPKAALPIGLGTFFGGPLLLEDNLSFFMLEDNISYLCSVGTC